MTAAEARRGPLGPDRLPRGEVTGARADAGARRRHPSARVAGDHLTGPASRLAAVLAQPPGPHPEVAVATVAVRGAQARSLDRFAAAYGLSVAEAAAIERGEISAARLPAPLRLLTPVPHLARRLGVAAAPGGAVRSLRGTGYGPRTVSDKG